ncbi:MAG TPA: extracellular solute-binding protein [Hyphomicrobiaceae bacterium]|nr:extracellular solute-binding protein [Hyphomicrobiaceae bacterium]
MPIARRSMIKGVVASCAVTLLRRQAKAQAAGPEDAAQIDLEKAKAEGKVVLYTSLDTQIVDAINAPFTQKYGIAVQYFRGGSSDVTSKVLAEADAGRPQADVVDASDLAALLLMKERKLLKPFKSAAAAAVASNLRDPDSTWITDRLTQAVIQYNSKELGSAPPKTWADLGKAALNGRLVYFSSANGDGAPRIYTLAKHLGWDVVKAMAATKPLRVQTPQIITQVLERGERIAGFLQNDNIAWRSKRQGKPTDYLFPAEGVPTEIGACGLLASSPRPHAAALYHEWWMGPEGQALLVKGGKYSSRTDVAPPEGSTPLSELKLLMLDYAEYKRDKTKILDQIADIFGGEWGN